MHGHMKVSRMLVDAGTSLDIADSEVNVVTLTAVWCSCVTVVCCVLWPVASTAAAP